MKHLSGYDNISETEAWHFWGHMKVLSVYLGWGLGTKGLHNDPADKTFLGQFIVNNVSKWSNFLLKTCLWLLYYYFLTLMWRQETDFSNLSRVKNCKLIKTGFRLK